VKMAEEKKAGKIAVVRVRGEVDIRRDIRDTLEILNLKRVNRLTIIDATATYIGMIQKAKDFITWGEVNDKTLTALIEKWGRKAGGERLDKKEAAEFSKKLIAGQTSFKKAGIKPYFKLHPPSKGYERGGIKQHVNVGGALGYRGDRINDLLAKMAGLKMRAGARINSQDSRVKGKDNLAMKDGSKK